MILQLHHQNQKTGKTEFCSQKEVPEDKESNEVRMKFIEDTKKEYPLPEEHIWMICNEDSPHFLYAAVER